MTDSTILGLPPSTLYETIAAILVVIFGIASGFIIIRRFHLIGNESFAHGRDAGAAETHAKWQRWADTEKVRHERLIEEARAKKHAEWQQWADQDKARYERLKEQARTEGHRAGIAAAKKAAETESRKKLDTFKAESDKRIAGFKDDTEKRLTEAREEGRKEAIEEARKNGEAAAILEQAAIRREIEAEVREDATNGMAGSVSEEDIESEIDRRIAMLRSGDPFPATIQS